MPPPLVLKAAGQPEPLRAVCTVAAPPQHPQRAFSRYRTPPCTSLVDRELVPAAKSSRSISAVRRPLQWRRGHGVRAQRSPQRRQAGGEGTTAAQTAARRAHRVTASTAQPVPVAPPARGGRQEAGVMPWIRSTAASGGWLQAEPPRPPPPPPWPLLHLARRRPATATPRTPNDQYVVGVGRRALGQPTQLLLPSRQFVVDPARRVLIAERQGGAGCSG